MFQVRTVANTTYCALRPNNHAHQFDRVHQITDETKIRNAIYYKFQYVRPFHYLVSFSPPPLPIHTHNIYTVTLHQHTHTHTHQMVKWSVYRTQNYVRLNRHVQLTNYQTSSAGEDGRKVVTDAAVVAVWRVAKPV